MTEKLFTGTLNKNKKKNKKKKNAVFLSIMDSPGRRPMLASTDFSSDYCNTNNSHSVSNSILDNNLADIS